MRRPVLLIILAVLVVSSALAGAMYWRWYNSPRYSLQQMALALKARDMQKFFNYMDLKAIFNNVLEASTKEAESPQGQNPAEDEWNRLARQLGRKFARQLLPQLFDNFEKQIRNLVQQYLLNLDNAQILGVMAAVTVARIEVTGEEAQVTLRDPKSKEDFRFQMRRYPDKTWRIVAVNYQDIRKFSKNELGL